MKRFERFGLLTWKVKKNVLELSALADETLGLSGFCWASSSDQV